MRNILFLVAAATGLYAQSAPDLFHKAPPAVDAALRARITTFYQLQLEGKNRQAEGMVADDTKDYFYNSGKPKYTGFKINHIDYSDDFTTAKAVVMAERIVMMPGLTNKPMSWPEPSKWKLVNGDWYWYLTDEDQHMTPMGLSKPTAGGEPGHIPSQEEMDKVLAEVAADKKVVTLKGGEESSETFVISNPLVGTIKLSVEAPPEPDPANPAFTARLDHADVPPGGKATITVEWKPGIRPAPRLIGLIVRAEPINIVIPLRIKFAN